MKIPHFHRRLAHSALIAVCATATGCIDDNYDLSDIDTTIQVSVNDLVLPIRIDDITLGDIITIDDDSRIKEIDGYYALIEEGTFQSEPVFIDPISIQPPYIAPINITARATTMTGITPKFTEALPIGRHTSPFDYITHNVSECIKSIDRIGTSFSLSLTISVDNTAGIFSSFRLTGFQLQLPAGLQGTPSIGTYDPATGIADLGNFTTTGTFVYDMAVNGIDASKANISFSADTRTFSFADEIGIAGGYIEPENIPGAVPQALQLSVNFNLSTLSITSFSGILSYSVNNFDIAPITLNNLPSVLDQPETDIALTNPQIYLSLINPLSGYGITAEAGLSITPWRNGVAGQSYNPDDGKLILDRSTQAGTGDYQFCLAPEMPAKYQPGYAEAAYRPYTGLRDILRGEGLPDELKVSILDPGMPTQQVNDLRIGTYEGPISGNYTFFAPLALAAGSEIVYTDTESGWNDADTESGDDDAIVDALTISTLEVTATVTNDLPVSIHMSGYPIDIDGNRIGNVEITGADITGGAKDQPLTIRMTGTVTHLDGITFTARATSANAATPLSPEQKITLRDIRAKVSGHYLRIHKD